jgi:hypothetical protein
MFAKAKVFLLLLSVLVFVPASVASASWFLKYGIGSKHELTQSSSVPKLIMALSDRDAKVRRAAVKSLRSHGSSTEAVLALAGMLNDQHPNVRADAAKILGAMGPNGLQAAPALLAALADQRADMRLVSLQALSRLGYTGEDFLAALRQMAAQDPHRRVKAAAIAALASPASPSSPAWDETMLAGSWTPAGGVEAPKTGQVNLHGVAVIIGNRNYGTVGKDVPDVAFAHNDADAMYRYVTETLGYREGNVILLKDASQADMIATFGVRGNPRGKLFDWVRPKQSDVFVYYSGHGAPGLGDGRSYLLPIDADPLKVELNGYLLETLYANLSQLPTKSTTVLLDSCFSGLTAAGSMIKNASSITLRPLEVKTDPSRMTVITASALNQVASWDDQAKHGLFTSHFLQGVSSAADQKPYGNGDGKVTLAELKRYMEEEVTYHARRTYGRDQNPQVSGNPATVLADLQGE